MTPTRAIQTFRELQWAANEGYPLGVPEDRDAQAEEAFQALTTHCLTRPTLEAQSAEWRRLMAEIEGPYQATVKPRARGRG